MPTVGRAAPDSAHTQSVRFLKDEWTEARARAWVKSHDFYLDGFEETENQYRFRQYDPSDRFVYRVLTDDLPAGVQFIIGTPK